MPSDLDESGVAGAAFEPGGEALGVELYELFELELVGVAGGAAAVEPGGIELPWDVDREESGEGEEEDLGPGHGGVSVKVAWGFVGEAGRGGGF